jgi:hypothetical protein
MEDFSLHTAGAGAGGEQSLPLFLVAFSRIASYCDQSNCFLFDWLDCIMFTQLISIDSSHCMDRDVFVLDLLNSALILAILHALWI